MKARCSVFYVVAQNPRDPKHTQKQGGQVGHPNWVKTSEVDVICNAAWAQCCVLFQIFRLGIVDELTLHHLQQIIHSSES